jgi:predicted amidohydrolase YtcJ
MNVCTRATVALLLAASLCATAQATPSADTIYVGGEILTMNDAQPQAEALAVKGGRIVAVGGRPQVRARMWTASSRRSRSVEPMAIKDIEVVETIKEGKTIYKAKA